MYVYVLGPGFLDTVDDDGTNLREKWEGKLDTVDYIVMVVLLNFALSIY